jgi:hypothetical protein
VYDPLFAEGFFDAAGAVDDVVDGHFLPNLRGESGGFETIFHAVNYVQDFSHGKAVKNLFATAGGSQYAFEFHQVQMMRNQGLLTIHPHADLTYRQLLILPEQGHDSQAKRMGDGFQNESGMFQPLKVQ